MKKNIITLCGAAAVLAAVMISAAACSADGGSGANDGGGGGTNQGGSMARFTLSADGNLLYTVDLQTLKVVAIDNPANPIFLREWNIGLNIETIFSKDNLLFIGSQDAMYIFDVSSPERPVQLSKVLHFRSCDPVVAYGNLAFVTLNSSIGSWCGPRGNMLQIYDITDPSNIPQSPIFQTNMQSPRGLSVDGESKLVFVCIAGGVEAWDFTTPAETEYVAFTARIPELEHIDAYDCIALPGGSGATAGSGTLLIVGADGLYQLAYDKSSENMFTFLSKIDIRKE